jgi:hypothetical protein
MSRENLVEAYIGGALNRRAFVRRLMATGVSAGAALGYAQVLAPAAEAAPKQRRRTVDDSYPLLVTKIVTRDIHDVRDHGRLKVKVTTPIDLIVHMGAFIQKGTHIHPLGYRPYDPEDARRVDAHTSKIITVPLNQNADGLKGMKKAKVLVETTTSTSNAFSVATATLK